MAELLVVGGTSGLGLEYVKHCNSRGDNVVVISRRASNLPGVTSILCNLADRREVDGAIREVSKLNLRFDSFLFFQRNREGSDKDAWQSEFDVSVSSTRAFLQNSDRMFREDGEKSIVIINSMAATFATRDASDAYQVSKAALLQLSRYYASILGRKGIRINTVTPFSFVKDSSRDFYDTNDKWHKIVEQRIPLGRICTPTDIINLVDFLISEKSQYITGQEIYIDGGLSLTLGVDLT